MQSHAPHGPPESIGPMLARLRLRRGHSQLRLAEQLCAAAGVPTVSRHEVSRWEREERVPGPFWIGWLAAVLEVPADELAAARPTRRPNGQDRAAVGGRDRPGAGGWDRAGAADAGGRPAGARASG